MDDAVGEMAVIGHNNKPCRIPIEPSHSKKSIGQSCEQIEYEFLGSDARIRADESMRFIEDKVDFVLFSADALSIDKDLVCFRTDHGLRKQDNRAIDLHAALKNQFLTGSA